ncbi:MAG: hypothetical protein K5853_04610 [Lachnospiraceae bacterium]|nr:hypothetical protein [Lachnospiraceae bacterium]
MIDITFSDIARTINTKVIMENPSPTVMVDRETIDFGIVPKDNNEYLDEKTITVTNSGNVDITLSEPTVTGSDFIIVSDLDGIILSPGETTKLTVSVKDETTTTADNYESTVKINTTGTASDTFTATLKVEDVPFDGFWIAPIPDQDYTGAAIKPAVNAYYYGWKLSPADFTVTYQNNINAAEKDATKTVNGKVVSIAPTVTIKGKGNYSGIATTTFTINALDISKAKADDIILSPTGQTQKGKTRITYMLGTKRVTLKENKDYVYDYLGQELKAPGSYTIAIRGKGNYKESKELLEKIIEQDEFPLSGVKISKIPNQKYTGDSFILAGVPGEGETRALTKSGKGTFNFVIKNAKNKTLTYGTDYQLTYENNKEIGTATVTVIGDGKYVGRRSVTFKITGTSLKKMKTEGFISSMGYTGTEKKQPMKFYYKTGKGKSAKKHYLIDGVDYDVQYSNNVSVGKATVTYTGKGAYFGKVKKTYKITGVNMKKVTVPKEFKSTTGSYGEGYYADRYHASTKSFAFMGNPFKVAGPEDGTQDYGIKLKYVHNGIAEDLVKGTDYTVSYAKNVNPGKATVIFTGMGRFTGKVKRNFTISPFDISKEHMDNYISDNARYRKGGARITTVNLQYRKYPYGWVQLQEGVDYTVKYKYNEAVTGASTRKKPVIIVTGKGCFKGTIKKEFTILGGNLNDTVLTAADVAFKNKAGAYKTGITLKDSSTGAKLKAGTDYDVNYEYTYRDNTVVKDADTGEDVNRSSGDSVGDKDIIPAKTRIKVEVNGKGYYEGTKQHGYFSVLYPSNAYLNKASINIKPKIYTGNKVTLSPEDITVKFGRNGAPLVYGVDYQIVDGSYRNNINKGTAKVTIEAMRGSGYSGRVTVSFRIVAKALSN